MEIGVVYRFAGRLVLAWSREQGIVFIDGEPYDVIWHPMMRRAASITMRELADAWGVSLGAIDRAWDQRVSKPAKTLCSDRGAQIFWRRFRCSLPARAEALGA